MGTVLAISVSAEKGTRKHNVSEALLVADSGIAGDAHAGPGHRQVSLLSLESIDTMRQMGAEVNPGDFAENITLSKVDLSEIAIGDSIMVGSAELIVTQLGKECHSRCAIFEAVGDCVMPREGIFTRVVNGGMIRPGDEVRVILHSDTETATRTRPL
ncbi:MAG: MOSC domain-containing protein [candidate division Zixibacteria bacterium]|nr:MOSC domain-containing protein [candidate division Zixibacteria bacterium]